MTNKRLLLAAAAMLQGALGAQAAQTVRVRIDKLQFSPADVSARVGDTVEWVNGDAIAHTATARNHAWDVEIPAKGSVRVRLRSAGEVAYFCRFHPNMTGRISVGE